MMIAQVWQLHEEDDGQKFPSLLLKKKKCYHCQYFHRFSAAAAHKSGLLCPVQSGFQGLTMTRRMITSSATLSSSLSSSSSSCIWMLT